jgi:uncharacterized repeat protein (TIGR01451 family)
MTLQEFPLNNEDLALTSIFDSAALLESAKDLAQSRLMDFAQSQDFYAGIGSTFGEGRDVDKLRDIWLTGNISFPTIEIRTWAELGNAYGAFSQETGKIYLAQELINTNSKALISAVLLEEYGHFVDSQVNVGDSAGDEGEIFSGIVQGKVFEAEQLKLLKAEDDHAFVSLDGKLVAIEQAGYGVSTSAGSGLDSPLALRTRILGLGSNGGEAVVYSLKPRSNNSLQLIIEYEGKTILDTGFVSATGKTTGTFQIPKGNSNELKVVLTNSNSLVGYDFKIQTVRKPILILPGIAGAFVNKNVDDYKEWTFNRGLNPTKLVMDPLLRSYDDLVATLVSFGYTVGEDLFVVPYDWRLMPGPNDGSRDGKISGISAESITDSKYEYGVDYLGYWLKIAAEKWKDRFPNSKDFLPLESVDVIAHSTGGLVTRAYIQSDAYGVKVGDLTLPKVDSFIMLGVPNQGAPKAWNPINDDWNSEVAYKTILRQFAYFPYEKLLQGQGNSIKSINGLTFINRLTSTDQSAFINRLTITEQSGNPDPRSQASRVAFIDQYIPTLKTLLATYDFGIPVSSKQENSFLLDLNVAASSITNKTNVSVVYGNGVDTITSLQPRIGPVGLFESDPLQSFTEGLDRNARAGERWWEEIKTKGGGDGTVPVISSTFISPSKLNQIYEAKGVEHGNLAADFGVQGFILKTLASNFPEGTKGGISAGIKKGLPNTKGSNPISLNLDPVEGFLVDGQGRRLGYSAATGALTEIPNSVWFGDSDGIGWVFGDFDGTPTVQLSGLGEDHYVQLSGTQGTKQFFAESSGFLAQGEQKNVSITVTDIPQDPNPPATGGDLEISVVVNPNTVIVGQNLTFTINLKNNGQNNSTGVVFRENLATGLKFIDANASKGQVSQADGIVSIDVGNLNSGESVTATIQVSPLVAGNLNSPVTVSSTETDPNPNNNSTTATVNVSGLPVVAADLELTQTVDNRNPKTGDEINFTLTLTNKGANTANNIKVKDLLPSQLDFVSALPEQGTYANQTGIWDVGSIDNNLTRTLKITAKLNKLAAITNTAEIIAVTETDPDSTPNNNNPNEDDQASISLNTALAIPSLTKIADDIFTISGGSANKPKLQITISDSNPKSVNDLAIFTVDDAQGKINGIAPTETGYTQAALSRAKNIFSAIANLPNGFDPKTLSRSLEFNSGDNLRFLLVKNDTLDNVRKKNTSNPDILFSNAANQKITDSGTGNFTLAWKDGSGNSSDFKDFVVNIQPTDTPLPLGANLQDQQQGEVLDLSSVDSTKTVQANFVVNREAAYNNFVGFYKITDSQGTIADPLTGLSLKPGDTGYAEAAIKNRIAGIDLQAANQSTATINGVFQGGSIFAPFIIANGSVNQLLDTDKSNDPSVYFAYLGANSDGVDHIRLLANNTFGFEDLPSGGDFDYNDIIIKANLSVT